MKSRVILFRTPVSRNSLLPALYQFHIPNTGTLEIDLGSQSLDSFAEKNQFLRRKDFDFAAGDLGAKCALMEWKALGVDTHFGSLWGTSSGQWLTFREAALALKEGTCRRYLQLAVQYLSSGGVVEDNVVAANTDEGLMNVMRSKLEGDGKPQ
jgi:hypothetical protein